MKLDQVNVTVYANKWGGTLFNPLETIVYQPGIANFGQRYIEEGHGKILSYRVGKSNQFFLQYWISISAAMTLSNFGGLAVAILGSIQAIMAIIKKGNMEASISQKLFYVDHDVEGQDVIETL